MSKLLLLLLFFSSPVFAETVTIQSKEPWTIKQCDKAGKRATSVFNVSLWNSGGWPLWRVTCTY